jgi:hypothetical protein
MDDRQYPGVRVDLTALLDELRQFFTDQDYEFQVRNESKSTVVQARKSSTLRDWTATSYAVTIRIAAEEFGSSISIGKQRWMDKAAVVGVGLMAGPLMPIVAGLGAFGAYRQYKATDGAWTVIERHMALRSGGVAAGPQSCPKCGTQTTGGRFCPECGQRL